jgi:hypothetical protein
MIGDGAGGVRRGEALSMVRTRTAAKIEEEEEEEENRTGNGKSAQFRCERYFWGPCRDDDDGPPFLGDKSSSSSSISLVRPETERERNNKSQLRK